MSDRDDSDAWLDHLDDFDVEMPQCAYCGAFATDLELESIGWTSADLEDTVKDEFDFTHAWYGVACMQQECREKLADTAADLAELGWGPPHSEPDPEREKILEAVADALRRDPLLARRLQPQQRPAGRTTTRWVVTVDDRARDRLRYLLRHHEIDWRWRVTVPYLRGSGRRIISVTPPHDNVTCRPPRGGVD